MATPKHPTPGVMKFTILVDPSSVIITMHLVCLNHVPEYKRFQKKWCNFTTWHIWPRKEPLPRGVMNFPILIDPSLVIITIYLLCLFYAWEKRTPRRF